MPTELYKLLHLFGLVLAFVAIGGLALHGVNGGTKDSNKARKLAAMTHGIGMLLLLLGGFGMLAKAGGGFPPWIIGKLAIWFLIGASMMPLQRKPELAKTLWFALPVLAIVAASLALYKPGV
jgi:hypothetical protein